MESLLLPAEPLWTRSRTRRLSLRAHDVRTTPLLLQRAAPHRAHTAAAPLHTGYRRRRCRSLPTSGDNASLDVAAAGAAEAAAGAADNGHQGTAPPATSIPTSSSSLGNPATASVATAAGGSQPQPHALEPQPALAAAAGAAAAVQHVQPPDHPQQPEQQQQQQQQPPAVPWSLGTTVGILVIWLVTFYAAAYSFVPWVLELAGLDAGSNSAVASALRNFVLDVSQLLVTVGILRLGLREYAPRRLGFFSLSLQAWRRWVWPIVAGAASFPAIDWVHRQLVALLAAEDYLVGGTVEQIASTNDWAALALWYGVLAVCAPVWEEVMFRGFLQPSLETHLPQWGATLMTAAIFSLVHFTKEGFLPLLLLGVVFGVVYSKTRSLWPPILLHSLWNINLLLQLALKSSGAA